MPVDVTITLAEHAAIEDEVDEALVDEGFVPAAPITAAPAAYAGGTTYAKGAYTTEGTQVYRSQQAANKGHKPSEDADFAWWAPVSLGVVSPLQNPTLLTAPATRTQQAHNNTPPARSDAAAAPLETIGVGPETPVS